MIADKRLQRDDCSGRSLILYATSGTVGLSAASAALAAYVMSTNPVCCFGRIFLVSSLTILLRFVFFFFKPPYFPLK